MSCVHLRQLFQLCEENELKFSGGDLVHVVCKQCQLEEVCPSLLVEEYEADHADNGKCLDEIKHWNGLTEAQKSEADAVAKRDEGSNAWAVGDKPACEAAYKQAIILATD